MATRRFNWTHQLVRITDKGAKARRDGVANTANPYTGGYRNQNGPGGNLQRQRRMAWSEGWELEDKRQRGID